MVFDLFIQYSGADKRHHIICTDDAIIFAVMMIYFCLC